MSVLARLSGEEGRLAGLDGIVASEVDARNVLVKLFEDVDGPPKLGARETRERAAEFPGGGRRAMPVGVGAGAGTVMRLVGVPAIWRAMREGLIS